MRQAVTKGRRICFANVVGMRTLCSLRRGKPANEWIQLLLWSLLLRILFLREPPFPMMMIVLFLLFTVSIQNLRESFGTILTMMVLFTFLNLLQLQIYMRELGRMSFLRETTRYRLLRELHYVGLMVQLASILQLNGLEDTMANWNVLISVNSDG
jgi:energy-coupling factor transporter transmembrane protein EcfT